MLITAVMVVSRRVGVLVLVDTGIVALLVLVGLMRLRIHALH